MPQTLLARGANSIDRSAAVIALGVVIAYRRWISPYKGFRCAHAAITHEPSCSDVALDALKTLPLSVAYSVIRQQGLQCRATYAKARAAVGASDRKGSTTAEVCCPCCGGPGWAAHNVASVQLIKESFKK